jgi:hypothetical protein
MRALDEFRKNAEQCFRMAEYTADPQSKTFWLELAETWRSLAEKAAPVEHRPRVRLSTQCRSVARLQRTH